MPRAQLPLLAAAVYAALHAGVAVAQTAAPAPDDLSEVIVKGQALHPEDSAFSATVLDGPEIRELARSNTDQLFREVPGMAVRDFQLAGVASAIVIRGFGNGGHGGDLGAVIDGISLNEAMSHADGYVDLNVVTPLEIDGFTVYKGPISALYGNFNRGGLVAIETRKTGDYREADLAAGSFGTVDAQGAYGVGFGDRQQVNLAAQLFRSDGFRPQSDTKRGTFSGRWGFQLGSSAQAALSARYHHSDSNSASYLLRSQFLADRDGIDPRVQNDGADKDFLTVRGDLNFSLSPTLKLLTYAYTTQQDFTRWYTRPVSLTTWRQREESYDRAVYGVGTSLNGEWSLSMTTLKYVAGVESLRESTEYEFYDGLNRRQRVSAALNNRDTSLNSLSAFAEVQAPLHPLAQLSLGLRADTFTGGCKLRGPETGTDPCGSLNDPEHVSPKLGLRSQVAPWLQLRGSWAEGFALPNNFVKYSVGGQPLNENVFRQTEVGARLAPSELFDLDVAAYRLTSTGEVRTVMPGVFENFGSTLRRGLEASASWKPIESLRFRAVYGATQTRVTVNADATLLNKRIPTVPVNTSTLEAFYAPTGGFGLDAAYRFVGGYFIDALNTARAESFSLLDLGASYRGTGAIPYRAYLRVENVSDRRYATSELFFSGNQRAVAPGAPRSFRIGVQVNL